MSSDWSDTMLDIAVTFFYHPVYMIIASPQPMTRDYIIIMLSFISGLEMISDSFDMKSHLMDSLFICSA